MNIQDMIKAYTDWLNSGFSAIKVGEYYELTTPYMDRFNDCFQIYVREEKNGRFHLTDDGNTISNLELSGVSFSHSAKKKAMLNQITNSFGISINNNCLEIWATKTTYPQKKHMLLQAMMTIDDVFTAESNPNSSFFQEDVGDFLDSHDIFYSRDFSLMGKTGSIYTYDYHIQRTKTKPEIFCKAINRINQSSRNLTLFNWIDTQEKRKDTSELVLFLNDEKPIEDEDLEAIQSYGIYFILWSQRQAPKSLALLI